MNWTGWGTEREMRGIGQAAMCSARKMAGIYVSKKAVRGSDCAGTSLIHDTGFISINTTVK